MQNLTFLFLSCRCALSYVIQIIIVLKPYYKYFYDLCLNNILFLWNTIYLLFKYEEKCMPNHIYTIVKTIQLGDYKIICINYWYMYQLNIWKYWQVFISNNTTSLCLLLIYGKSTIMSWKKTSGLLIVSMQ